VSRIVSFVVLVAILLVIAGLFFQVMANFLLPLFLAVLLVIMFGPLHRWFIAKCRGRDRLAAGLTTAAILLILLVPVLLILVPATLEGIKLYQNEDFSGLDPQLLAKTVVDTANRVGVDFSAEDLQKTIVVKIQEWLAPLALSTTQYLGRTVIGLGVMIIALYYFLADGPGMVRTVMRLSPLDDKYEEQLIERFDDMTRAVVVATALSAFVQGLLAGIGFFFAGVPMVFLLTVLAMLFAMVPFVGTTIVWVPACLWLYFHDGRTGAAALLAIYCVVVVSLADNLIKPIILHGRSNLHPLLALLSVLGGVQALGPIGIFVGPMVVAFLQTLLNMLQTELDAMGQPDGG